MTKINVDMLSEEELIELNHKIISRLRFLREMRSHVRMMDFHIGERVSFRPPGEPEITGTLTRYNKKSVTVITDGGERWNVHPGLLLKIKSTTVESVDATKVGGSIIAFRQPGSKKP
jgi:hypothetical protein